MKTNFRFLFFMVTIIFLASNPIMAQVSINTTGNDPDVSSILDLSSDSHGMLIPRLTLVQRGNIDLSESPAGLLIYQTDNQPGFYYYDGANWNTPGGWTESNDTLMRISGNDTLITITNSGKMGVGTTTPETLLEISSGSPYLTIHNTNHTNSDFGRNTEVDFKGEQSGGEISKLGILKFSHDGTNDDQSGRFEIKVNDGNDGNSPNTMFRIDKNFGIAMGESTIASYKASTAMGSNTSAIRDYSTAMGDHTKASGVASTAMGDHTKASGLCSTTMGYNTTASGNYSVAMGNHTTASGNYSIALGDYTKASGIASTAMGNYTTASGSYSTAMGFASTASGEYSTVIGKEMKVSGDYSFGIALCEQNYFDVTKDSVMAIMGGKVGIGTGSPETELQIVGKAYATEEFALNPSKNVRIALGNSPNANSTDNGDMEFQTDNNFIFRENDDQFHDVMVIRGNSGKVGIGTSNPQSLLEVNGGVKIANDTDPASASKVGTLRYRSNSYNSYLEICMQTGPNSYGWILIHKEIW